MRDYFPRWLEAVGPGMKPSSHRRYTEMTNKHFIPYFGNILLGKLSPLNVQGFYTDRLATGLSGTTVNLLHNILHNALKQAVQWGLIMRNVTEVVEPPRKVRSERTTWNARQVSTFFAKSDQDENAAFWRMAILTGMRRGEVLGLRWEDVDLVRGALSVRRTLSRGAKGGFELGEPKTASGRRQVALPPSVVASLQEHRVRQLEGRLRMGEAYHDQGFVFANSFGEPLHPNTLRVHFRKLATEASVPLIRIHDMRHTSATLSLENGEHPKVVSERLGHSNIAITLDLYSHVTPDMQKGAAERLDKLIEGAS
jgi:integrase